HAGGRLRLGRRHRRVVRALPRRGQCLSRRLAAGSGGPGGPRLAVGPVPRPDGHLRRGPGRRPGGDPHPAGPPGDRGGAGGPPPQPRKGRRRGGPAGPARTPREGPRGVGRRPPPASAPPLAPHWRYVTPFAMTAGEQFRPLAPPAPGSAEYTTAFNE